MVKNCRGFTLVEILIVMVIIGLMAGITVLAIGGDPHQQLKQEAQRIRLVLQLAADQALLQSQEIGVKLTEHGYQVLRFDDDQQIWLEAHADNQSEAFSPYQLPDEITLNLQAEGSIVDLTTLNTNDQQLDQKETQQNTLKPSLLLLSSGEMSPFELHLNSADAEHQIRLFGDGLGAIQIGAKNDD